MSQIYPNVYQKSPISKSDDVKKAEELRKDAIRKDMPSIEYCLSVLAKNIERLSSIDGVSTDRPADNIAIQVAANKRAVETLRQVKGELERRKQEIK